MALVSENHHTLCYICYNGINRLNGQRIQDVFILMNDSLTRHQYAILQEVSRPSSYLCYTKNRRLNQSPSSILQFVPRKYKQGIRQPGVHRMYQLLNDILEENVERFFLPSRDMLEACTARDVQPWSLESLQPIFQFPLWFVYLSHPRELMTFQSFLNHPVVKELFQTSGRDAPHLFGVMLFSCSRSDREILDTLYTPSPDQAGNTNPFETFSGYLEDHSAFTLRSEKKPVRPASIASMERPVLDPPVSDSFVVKLGDVPVRHPSTVVFQNHWPPSSTRSPGKWIDVVDRLFQETGLQEYSMGPMDQIEERDISKTMEFVQRFHARLADRPVSIRLLNPVPSHPLFHVPHLGKRYSRREFHVYTGEINHWMETFSSFSGEENWPPSPVCNYNCRIKCTVDLRVDQPEASTQALEQWMAMLDHHLQTRSFEGTQIMEVRPLLFWDRHKNRTSEEKEDRRHVRSRFAGAQAVPVTACPDGGWLEKNRWKQVFRMVKEEVNQHGFRMQFQFPDDYSSLRNMWHEKSHKGA